MRGKSGSVAGIGEAFGEGVIGPHRCGSNDRSEVRTLLRDYQIADRSKAVPSSVEAAFRRLTSFLERK